MALIPTLKLAEHRRGDGDGKDPFSFKVALQAEEVNISAKQKVLDIIDKLSKCCCLGAQESRTKSGTFVSVSVNDKSGLLDGYAGEDVDVDRDAYLSSSSKVRLRDASTSLENDAIESKSTIATTSMAIIDFDEDADADADDDILQDDNIRCQLEELQSNSHSNSTIMEDGERDNKDCLARSSMENIANANSMSQDSYHADVEDDILQDDSIRCQLVELQSNSCSNSCSNSTIMVDGERDNQEIFCSARSSMENIANVDSMSQDSDQEPIESFSISSTENIIHDSDRQITNEQQEALSEPGQSKSSERLERGSKDTEVEQDGEDSISMSIKNGMNELGNKSSHDKPAKALKNLDGEDGSSPQNSATPKDSSEDTIDGIAYVDHDNFLTRPNEHDEISEIHRTDRTDSEDNVAPEKIDGDKSREKVIGNNSGIGGNRNDDDDYDSRVVDPSMEHESSEDVLRTNISEEDPASKYSKTPQMNGISHSFENMDIGIVRASIKNLAPVSHKEGNSEISTMDTCMGRDGIKSVHSRNAVTSEGATVVKDDLFHSCIDADSDMVLTNAKDGQQLNLSRSNSSKDESTTHPHNEEATIVTNGIQSKDYNSDEEMTLEEESYQTKSQKKEETKSTESKKEVADEDELGPFGDKFVTTKSNEDSKGENGDAVREEISNFEISVDHSSEESWDGVSSFEQTAERDFAKFREDSVASPMTEGNTPKIAVLSQGLGDEGIPNRVVGTEERYPSILNTDLKASREDTCNVSIELSTSKDGVSISKREETGRQKANASDAEQEIDGPKQNTGQDSAMVSTLNGQVLAYQESIDLYKQRVEELNHGTASFKRELDEKEKMVNVHDETKEALEKDNIFLSDLVKSGEEGVKTLQSEVDEYKIQLSSLQSSPVSSIDHIICLTKDVANLTETVGVKNDLIQSQNDEMDRLKKENVSLVNLCELQGEEIRSLQSEVANYRQELSNLEVLSTMSTKEIAGLNHDVTTLTNFIEKRDKEFSMLKDQIKSREHTIQLYEEEFVGFVKDELSRRRGQRGGPLATLESKQSNIAAEDATRNTSAVPSKSLDHRSIGIRQRSSSSFGSSAESKNDSVGSGVKLTNKLLKGRGDFLAMAQRISYKKTRIPDSVKKVFQDAK